ncbi:MAG: helix-hairpin-helix domain-containing protein [Gemmataceae bacterium]|nr:helix-hairpin-helix domain-containing protein [Gemmataceae bacterium]
MHPITPQECSRIAQDLQIRKVQVESVIQLLDEGNTVPFITRYRKERTGGLNEDVIRQIQRRANVLRSLADRKATILRSIENQGRLTPELREAILHAETNKRLDDLYLPYKPKKKTLAAAARDKGLEPLALAIAHSDPAVENLDEMFAGLVNPEKGLNTPDDVKAGVGHILAEIIHEAAEARAPVRAVLWETGQICAGKNEKLPEGQGQEYKDYFTFKEGARQIPPHRILAINRGEKDGALKIHLDFDRERVNAVALRATSEILLKRAGQPQILTPARPQGGPRGAAQTSATEVPPVETPTGETPPSDAPPAEALHAETPVGETPAPVDAAQTTPPSEVVETPHASPADLAPAPTAETSPAPESAPESAETPSEPATPEAAPLVASMSASVPMPELKGEPLVPDGEFKTPFGAFWKLVLDDALARLLLPNLEREIRHELTDEAESHAVAVFARNLRSLLMQPPLHGRRVLAIDPGYRTGCKLAVLDEYGNLTDNDIIYPFGPPPKKGRERGERGERGRRDAAPAAPSAESATPPETSNAAPSPENASAPPAEETPTPAPAAEAPPADIGTQFAETPVPPPESTPVAEQPPVQVPSPGTMAAPTEKSTPPAPEATPAAPPAPPVDRRAEAKAKLAEMVRKHQIQVVALGNGSGCRETEEIVAEVIGSDIPELAYVIVNEAGASHYSVSQVGREEFPNFDATLRSTISIGRRLQDPLSELVKVEPQNVGVGLYQHDMSKKELKESLDGVVESCVNTVGVDLNTASVPLLRHVSGLNQLVAREIVEYRKQHGAFTSRDQLMQVSGFGPTRYVQSAGFLKIPASGNPLDRTWIHPESYGLAEQLLAEVGAAPATLEDKAAQDELRTKFMALDIDEVAKKHNAGVPTVLDILDALARPGRDPREDLPAPVFKKGILKIEDLQAGMQLKGTVLNVVDFGAFVDIGLKDSGLVHISEMANHYIKSPYAVVAVNDVVSVWVKAVDKERHRVSLTMIEPGTERKPPERRPQGAPRQAGPPGARPPRPQGRGPGPGGRGPGGPQGEAQPAGQGQGQDRRQGFGGGNRPPRQGGGRPPGRFSGPPQGAPAGQGDAPRPAAPPPPPRKPRREPPKPKLSQAALEGKASLRTFAELGAFFAAHRTDAPDTPPPPAPGQDVPAETPPVNAEQAPSDPKPEEPANPS